VIGSYKTGVDSQISNSANDEYLGRWLRGRIGIRRELRIGERFDTVANIPEISRQ
jgi:hypothetical protein